MKMTRKYLNSRTLNTLLSLLFLAPLLLGNGECNTFIGSADKNSDDALMYEARQKVNDGDYDGALEVIANLSTSRRQSHEGRVLEATALSGKCGLDFIKLAKDIVDGIDANQLFKVLGANMRAATSYDYCAQAETVLLGTQASEMTSDDQIFLVFLEFAKLGAILAASGAIDANGSVVPTYDSCTDLDDDATGHIGTAITIAINAIAASGISVAGSTTEVVKQLCDAIDTLPIPGGNPCGITDPTAFTHEQKVVIRSFVQSNEIGLDTCGGPITDFINCVCPL